MYYEHVYNNKLPKYYFMKIVLHWLRTFKVFQLVQFLLFATFNSPI